MKCTFTFGQAHDVRQKKLAITQLANICEMPQQFVFYPLIHCTSTIRTYMKNSKGQIKSTFIKLLKLSFLKGTSAAEKVPFLIEYLL